MIPGPAEELGRGLSVRDAVATTLDTAGRAVWVSGLAVVVSLGFSIWFSGGVGARWLSIATLLLLGVWFVAATSAGRQFHTLEKKRC